MKLIDTFPTNEYKGLQYRVGRVLPFGATLVEDNGVNFSIFSKEAVSCTLVLYRHGEEEPFAEIPFPQEFRIGNVYTMMVFGITIETTEYGYRFDGVYDPRKGLRFDKNKVVLDPYAKSVSGRSIWGKRRKPSSAFVHRGQIILEDYDWEGDKPLELPMEDLIIYEMHVRGFTRDPSSKIKYPGTYAGIVEKIPYLKSLGINCVELMPVFAFDEFEYCQENSGDSRLNYWGYSTLCFFAPKAGYAASGPLGMEADEFKNLIKKLHQNGIAVILDVVYNHTYDIDHSNFQKTYPDYFYRKNADGTYSNGSGCGNETASEQPMMRQFMIESVKYWIREYHIDGFRFDLMAVHDIATMNAIRQAVDEIDPTIFIYGEGWSAGSCAYPQEKLGMKANIAQMPRIAAFSDEIRDALRGPFSDDTKGAFLAGIPGEEESLKFGIAGAISHPHVDMTKVNYSQKPWAMEPTQMMSYVSCHDDMCLVDRLLTSIPSFRMLQYHGDKPVPTPRFSTLNSQLKAELIRLDLLAQTAVFTSQGVPFMLSGEEMLRDKKGVHNSFQSPDSVNHLDWNRLQQYPQVFHYYKNLIQLRKNHPAFRLGSAELVRRHLEFLETGDCVVAFRLKDNAGGDPWRNIIVVLNANSTPVEVKIPKGRYTEVCCDGSINEQGLGEIEGDAVTVSSQSALILHD